MNVMTLLQYCWKLKYRGQVLGAALLAAGLLALWWSASDAVRAPERGTVRMSPAGPMTTGHVVPDRPHGAVRMMAGKLQPGPDTGPSADMSACDDRWQGLEGPAFIAALERLPVHCLDPLFRGRETWLPLVEEARLMEVADAARDRAMAWDGRHDNGLAMLSLFLKAGYYLHRERLQDVLPPLSADLDARVMALVAALLANPALWLVPHDEAMARDPAAWRSLYNTVNETLMLADSVRVTALVEPVVAGFMARYEARHVTTMARHAMYPLQRALHAIGGQTDFRQRTLEGREDALQASLNRLVAAGETAFHNGEEYRNVVRLAGYFAGMAPTRQAAVDALVPLLAAHPRLSPTWSHAAYALNKGQVDCARYRFCHFERDLRAMLFPLRHSYDGGRLVVETGLPAERIEPVYYALQQVRKQFHRKVGVHDPVPGDRNAVLTVAIYGSRRDYRDYQIILDELSVDNGGLYVEGMGKIFTFDREAGHAGTLSLEGILRHEYVHYLAGRYLQPGLAGATAFYARTARMPWFDEGLAEWLAGARQEDVVPDDVIRLGLRALQHKEDLTTAEIMQAAYGDGTDFYYHAAVWMHVLDTQAPARLAALWQRVRADDPEGFDAWVADAGRDGVLGAQQLQHVARLRQETGAAVAVEAGRDWLPQARWQLGEPAQVQGVLGRYLPLACTAQRADSVLPRFACEGLVGPAPAAGWDVWLAQLQRGLRYAAGNNFMAMQCLVRPGANRLRCEGPLADAAAQAPSSPFGH